MDEDARYRTSSQFRYWSFTPSALNDLRRKTNELATQRVKAAHARARASRNAGSADISEAERSTNGTPVPVQLPDGEVDCLTAEEELKLLRFYELQCLKLGEHLELPTDVKSTALIYLKRFYLTNSLMSYDPTAILKTALFFATKTENHYFNLTKFAAAIGKTTPEDVLAVEFLLTQALRFQFDVRHPFRALEGAIMEMLALVGENAPPLPGAQPIEAPQELGDAGNRIKRAHGKAREVLKSSALLTDAYFHFTPSQIMMASLALADSEVASWYLSTKLSNQPDLLSKIQEAIQQCVNMLSEVSPNAQPTEQEMKELKQLNKKLNRCRDPDRTDLSKLKERAKRDGMGEEDEERQAKKRKMEREKVQKEGDDLFGPSLKR